MIKFLKKLWCERFHIWARASIVCPNTGKELTIAEECLTCGRKGEDL